MYSLAILTDGRLASGSDNGAIRVWDLGTGACDWVLEGNSYVRQWWGYTFHLFKFTVHIDSMTSLTTLYIFLQAAFSLVVLSDGRLASGSSDNTIRVWDLGSGACDRVLEGHTDVRKM